MQDVPDYLLLAPVFLQASAVSDNHTAANPDPSLPNGILDPLLRYSIGDPRGRDYDPQRHACLAAYHQQNIIHTDVTEEAVNQAAEEPVEQPVEEPVTVPSKPASSNEKQTITKAAERFRARLAEKGHDAEWKDLVVPMDDGGAYAKVGNTEIIHYNKYERLKTGLKVKPR